jgi:cytochrome c553
MDMSHMNSFISAGIVLTAIVMSTGSYAQSDNERYEDQISPLTGHKVTKIGDDSPESIKLRRGPGDPITGNAKSQLCQGCHGEFGISTDPLIPKLAGQYGGYIQKQVLNYQSGVRSHQIMNAMAATLKDDDIADVAAYFASQKKMWGESSPENERGKNIFIHGDLEKMRLACIGCHGVHGKGFDPKTSMFPVIGGQHKEYIRRQLFNFREGYRTNSPNGIMNRIASSLTDDDIEAVAEYLSVQ